MIIIIKRENFVFIYVAYKLYKTYLFVYRTQKIFQTLVNFFAI